MRKPILAAAAACAALSVGIALPALAQAEDFPTTVTIRFVDRPGPDIFRGRVESPNPQCIENRAVRLFRVAPGPDSLIDTDRSEDNGSWSIDVEGDPIPGNYYVKVPARNVGADLCLRGRSATIPVAG